MSDAVGRAPGTDLGEAHNDTVVMPGSSWTRVDQVRDPFLVAADAYPPGGVHWPARWIGPSISHGPPIVVGYRLAVRGPRSLRVHVSADERYELYLDGTLLTRGPDRGDLDHWTYASYDVALAEGEHWLAARVWSLGDQAPHAQLARGHGFLFATHDPELCTGVAPWRAAVLPGHGMRSKGVAWGGGARLELDGRRFPWGWSTGHDELAWSPAMVGEPAYAAAFAQDDVPPTRLLVPTGLPEQASAPFTGGQVRHVAPFPGGDSNQITVRSADSLANEVAQWEQLLAGSPLAIPPHTRRRVIIDLEEYVCAYPHLQLSGGRAAAIRMHWQECLFEPDGTKGNRDQIEGKHFTSFRCDEDGVGDRFVAGGGDEHHTSLWWSAGRYVEVTVETAAQPLAISELRFEETGYPYANASRFAASDARWTAVERLACRTLQMCSHETAMDCPYYEQLQYAGDTRIQALVAYATTGDDRLARQALLAFDRSRGPDGLTQSRYPSRIRQTIPPFSLWWVAMVHDFALWRGDLEFVARLLPGVRGVLDAHRRGVDRDGLFYALPGWNFTDWVPDWSAGVPPQADGGPSGMLQLQLAHVASLAADLERWAGSELLAAHHQDLADGLRGTAADRYWSEGRGLYADDLAHTRFSEHAQCLAVLADAQHGPEAVDRTIEDDDPALARATVYYAHYLFDAYGRIGRTDALLARMSLWFDHLDQGLRTIPESPEPSRSDCHAWGAHPLLHAFTTILGIRPVAPGMARVTINPQLAALAWAEGTIPTPRGPLTVRAERGNEPAVNLPDGITLVPPQQQAGGPESATHRRPMRSLNEGLSE